MEKGDPSYVTGLSFPVHAGTVPCVLRSAPAHLLEVEMRRCRSMHAGTHIDLPSTMVQKEMAAGNTLERVDLTRLIGAARVVEVPAGSNITGTRGVPMSQ